MKRCPECRRDYFDDSLKFCLDDGTALLEGPVADGPETQALPPGTEEETKRLTISGLGSGPLPMRTRKSSKWFAFGFLLVSALGVGGYLYLVRGRSVQIASVAVLPFQNESGHPDAEYLSDGMTEVLIANLSRIPNLRVKSRSSVFRFKNSGADLKEIGRELSVQAVLTGRVVQRDQVLTFHIELVDAETEDTIWKRSYDRSMSNLSTLQNEIARDVSARLRSDALGVKNGAVGRKDTEDSEALRLYLLGRFHFNLRNKPDLYRAIDYFQRSAERDSNYALPHAGLADCYIVLQGYDRSVSPREMQSMARKHARRALDLDDSLSEAHSSLGIITHTVDFDPPAAEVSFRRAIDLDPTNSAAYQNLAYMYLSQGRLDEAEAGYKSAIQLDPNSPIANRNYAQFLLIVGRYAESEAKLRELVMTEPNFRLGYLNLANALFAQEKFAEAAEVYAVSQDLSGKSAEANAMRSSYATKGWRGFVLDFERFNWLPDSPHYMNAIRFASIGENDIAVERLRRSVEDREGFACLINVDSRLKHLSNNPRFQELLRTVGF